MNALKKSMVFSWVAMILVASTCFGADVHYCKGEVQSFSLYSKAKPCKSQKEKVEKKVSKCCMARKMAEKEPSKGYPIMKNGGCCYNDQVAFKTDSKNHSSEVQLPSAIELNSASFSSNELCDIWNVQALESTQFRGPPDQALIADYQVFFQVFLI